MKEKIDYRGYKIEIHASRYEFGPRSGLWSGAYKFWDPSTPKVVHIAGCGALPSAQAARAKALQFACINIDEKIAAARKFLAAIPV